MHARFRRLDGLGYSYHFMKRAYANFGQEMETTLSLWADDPYAIAPGNDASRERLRGLLQASPHNLDFVKHRLAQEPEDPASAGPRVLFCSPSGTRKEVVF